MTKKEYQKKYYQANKERIDSYRKAWDKDNEDKVSAYRKTEDETHKDGLYTVYLLPKENYVGVTSSLTYRLRHHKSNGKDVSDAKILGKYHTKDEARRIEDGFHNNGFKGAYGFQQRMEEFNKPEAIARRKEIEEELLLIGKRFNLK